MDIVFLIVQNLFPKMDREIVYYFNQFLSILNQLQRYGYDLHI